MINTYNESSLHEQLKKLYCGNKGQTEVSIGKSICDGLTAEGMIIEIQTAAFRAIKLKLERLLSENFKILLVHPIAINTMIETRYPDGTIAVRRSPKHESFFTIFRELDSIGSILCHPNLIIVVASCSILELRVADGTGSWRRKGVRTENRCLISLETEKRLCGHNDWTAVLPESLPELFTSKDLANCGAGKNAGTMARTLCKAGVLRHCGSNGRLKIYRKLVW